MGRGRVAAVWLWFRLGCRRFGVEHERFCLVGDAGVPGVGDNWCTHRDMDSVQESSRCKQTKPSLWPTRPAGRIRDHSPVARAGLSPGLAWYAPRAIGTRSQAEKARRTDSEPWSGRSPGRDHPNRRQCPERGTHTKPTTHAGRTHRERPLTPVDSTQIGSQQYGNRQLAVGSTQHRKEVTPHMHTPATTHPQDRHTQRTAATTLALGEPTPPAHPDPASAAEPAPAPAPAPARPWTPDGPARRTDSSTTTTAAASTAVAVAVAVATAQAHQTRQPRPRQHTPTTATPASVAASPNPDRHSARPGNTTAKARRRSVADACSSTEDRPGPSQRPRAISHRSVAAVCSSTEVRPGPSL